MCDLGNLGKSLYGQSTPEVQFFNRASLHKPKQGLRSENEKSGWEGGKVLRTERVLLIAVLSLRWGSGGERALKSMESRKAVISWTLDHFPFTRVFTNKTRHSLRSLASSIISPHHCASVKHNAVSREQGGHPFKHLEAKRRKSMGTEDKRRAEKAHMKKTGGHSQYP